MIFVNKMDREGKDPFDILDELEEVTADCRTALVAIDAQNRFKGV